MKILRFFWLVFVLTPAGSRGQDTIFVNKHNFPTPVRQVLAVGNLLYVKTGDGLYQRSGGTWEKQDLKFDKPFLFYNKGWVESDYLPVHLRINVKSMARLIPQLALTNASGAEADGSLFISVGGSLYEYQINKFYNHSYGDRSVRNIYVDDSLKVVSTYDGIFVNDTIRLDFPKHANGYFTKVGSRYFLSSDKLFEFFPPREMREIPAGTNAFAGNSRKLFEYRDAVYALNTKSLNRFHEIRELLPVHQGFEYMDAEVIGGMILFCTQTGEVFSYDGDTIIQRIKLNTRVRDIYGFNNTVFLSSDEGVYTFNGKDSASLKLLTRTPYSVMTLVDLQRNTWIATENGLFILPDGKRSPIPIIPDVEFNRGALTVYEDRMYAGSISGVYDIDTYEIVRTFLPVYFNKKEQDQWQQRKKLIWIGAGTLILALGIVAGIRHARRGRAELVFPQKATNKPLTLDQIAADIRTHGIMTVDGMAEFYETNTVQLNRRFKSFGTTPGRFMKQVKLAYAREMLEQKTPMEEVVSKVGYSAAFIRKELQMLTHSNG